VALPLTFGHSRVLPVGLGKLSQYLPEEEILTTSGLSSGTHGCHAHRSMLIGLGCPVEGGQTEESLFFLLRNPASDPRVRSCEDLGVS
jgi:hypothetical protein